MRKASHQAERNTMCSCYTCDDVAVRTDLDVYDMFYQVVGYARRQYQCSSRNTDKLES